MHADETHRWRQADRLFAQWLSLPPAQRAGWRLEADVPADVGTLLQRMIDCHLAEEHQPTTLQPFTTLFADAPAAGALAGRTVGDWTLIDELGRGGMSVVYRARRQMASATQDAAVKLLGMTAIGTEGERRFEQERRVLARLRHPHIAALIDGGIADDGTPFLAMTLVEGATLAHYCRAHVPDWPGRVRLVRLVCDAVAHAHRNLLVHRDIKPSNIIVTTEGVPVLVDFGIARLLDEDREHTRTGMRALTPGYAAPEQIADGAITTATDVYALGRVLKTLCDDSRPLPADLRNIIAKACHTDPGRRYVDARALGDDLDNLLQQRPVQATPDSVAYRLRVLLRRHRGAVVATTMIALSLMTGLGLALWQAQRASREADEARHQAARAEAARDFLFSLIRSGDPEASERPDLPVSAVVAQGAASLREFPPDDAELHAEMAMMLGQLETALGRHSDADVLLDTAETAANTAGDVSLRIGVLTRRGTLANARGDPAEALRHFGAALDLLPSAPAARKAALMAGVASGWAYAMESSGREADARQRLRHELAQPYLRPPTPERARLLSALAMATDEPDAQLELLLAAQDIYARTSAPPTDRLALAANLGSAYAKLHRDDESLRWNREAVRLADRVHPGATSRRARAYSNLASAARRSGYRAEAIAALTTAEDIFRELGDDGSPAFAALLNNQTVQLLDAGHPDMAVEKGEQTLALARAHFGEDDARSLGVERLLVMALSESGETARAESRWRDLVARLPDDTQPALRQAVLLTGADVAAQREDVQRLDERLAEAARDAVLAGDSLETPALRMRRLMLAGMSDSLKGDVSGADKSFANAEAIGQTNATATWPLRWRNALAWAAHLERHGRADEARARRASAHAMLAADGLDTDSDLHQRLRGDSAAAAPR